jgi:hypothetical protein
MLFSLFFYIYSYKPWYIRILSWAVILKNNSYTITEMLSHPNQKYKTSKK